MLPDNQKTSSPSPTDGRSCVKLEQPKKNYKHDYTKPITMQNNYMGTFFQQPQNGETCATGKIRALVKNYYDLI